MSELWPYSSFNFKDVNARLRIAWSEQQYGVDSADIPFCAHNMAASISLARTKLCFKKSV